MVDEKVEQKGMTLAGLMELLLVRWSANRTVYNGVDEKADCSEIQQAV